MSDEKSLKAARGVLGALGPDNVVIKVQPGGNGALPHVASAQSIYHEGVIAHADLGDLNGADEAALAELRAALLVIAADGTDVEAKLDLSDKDVAYLRLVCEGLNDAQCAERLGLSLRAIKSRKKSVLTSAACTSLSQAVQKFFKSNG